MDMERRVASFRCRSAGDDGAMCIEGYAAVYNQLSDDLGGFRERIAPGAFAGVIGDDVRAFLNHNSDLLLGRSASGTLRLDSDDKGLRFELDLPDTGAGRDLWTLMQRGDLSQTSFGFSVGEQAWDRSNRAMPVRTVETVSRLWEISPCSIPAYPQTEAAIRSLKACDRGLSLGELMGRDSAVARARRRRIELLSLT